MKNSHGFDVLVVYSDGIAKSSANRLYQGTTPFPADGCRANYNDSYAYFLETCKNAGLTAAFATTADVITAGTCSCYWTFNKNTWKRVKEQCFSRQIFDKFSPINTKKRQVRDLLFDSGLVIPFNDPWLTTLFFDKLLTYKNFSDHTIPTVPVNITTRSGIRQAIRKLRELTSAMPVRKDFTDAIILKDRFGAGGNNIFKVEKEYESKIYSLVRIHKNITFVLQPFAKFTKGYAYQNNTAATDIRLIYQNGSLLQTYIRMARPTDFRCNEHQGGTLIYTETGDIPQKVLALSARIAGQLRQDNSLFALDYIVSDLGNVYFLEGNIGPGLDWNLKLKKNERKSKELINSIVTEIAARAKLINNEQLTEHTLRSFFWKPSLRTDTLAVIAARTPFKY